MPANSLSFEHLTGQTKENKVKHHFPLGSKLLCDRMEHKVLRIILHTQECCTQGYVENEGFSEIYLLFFLVF